MKKSWWAAPLFCLAVHGVAMAGEAEVRKAVEGKIGRVSKVDKAPMAGWWEVIADGQVFFVDDKGSYLMAGALIDLKTDRNISADRQAGLAKDMVFSNLPLALKQVRGTGKNVLVTFEDPNCGYCKKLAKDLAKMNNITVYTFLYPVLGDDSMDKSRAIWCSSDRAKTWVDWMVAGKSVGTATDKCDTAGLEQSIDIARKLHINGTPALFFANGERVGGYIAPSEIEKRFGAAGG